MSLKDYANRMLGSQVVVEDEAGDLFTGTLKKYLAYDQLKVELSYALKITAVSEINYTQEKVADITLKAIRISSEPKKRIATERAFLTDSKIAANNTNQNGGNDHFDESDNESDLQEWEDDGCGEYDSIDCGNNVIDDLDKLGGWSVTDMFHANRDKCVGNGTVFDESEFSNVGIGEHSKEALEKAQAIAKQISMNPASRHNAQLENEDEERDLDAATKFDVNEESPPPEPSPPQIEKDPTPVPNRKYSGGGRKSAERAVSTQSSEQGDKEERKFKLDLNALPFFPSSKASTKSAESTTITNTNLNPVSSAPVMPSILVVYNNGNIGTTTTATNNLATLVNNFGNNFMTNQLATFVPVPVTLQQFQYAQIQHQQQQIHPPMMAVAASAATVQQQQSSVTATHIPQPPIHHLQQYQPPPQTIYHQTSTAQPPPTASAVSQFPNYNMPYMYSPVAAAQTLPGASVEIDPRFLLQQYGQYRGLDMQIGAMTIGPPTTPAPANHRNQLDSYVDNRFVPQQQTVSQQGQFSYNPVTAAQQQRIVPPAQTDAVVSAAAAMFVGGHVAPPPSFGMPTPSAQVSYMSQPTNFNPLFQMPTYHHPQMTYQNQHQFNER